MEWCHNWVVIHHQLQALVWVIGHAIAGANDERVGGPPGNAEPWREALLADFGAAAGRHLPHAADQNFVDGWVIAL